MFSFIQYAFRMAESTWTLSTLSYNRHQIQSHTEVPTHGRIIHHGRNSVLLELAAHFLYQTLTTIKVSWKLDAFASGLAPGEEVMLLFVLFASEMRKGHLCV